MEQPLSQIMLIEKDLCVCALLSRLISMVHMPANETFDDSYTMELVKAVDEDEDIDLYGIGVAFLMEAVATGKVEMGELYSCLFSAELLNSLSFFLRDENEDDVSHTIRLSHDYLARKVKLHDVNLRLNKLDQTDTALSACKIAAELYRAKSILESTHVRNITSEFREGQSLN